MFNLYHVAVFNPTTGKIYWSDVVAAKDSDSAKNKGVAALTTQTLPEGATLEQLLDETKVVVNPF